VLALRELEDRSYAEIGELVDMKENAVAQLIFRARESLRLELRLAQVDPERLPEECRRYLPLLAGAPRRPAEGRAAGGDAGAPRRLRALPGRAREHAGGFEALPDPLSAGFLETDEARAAVERRLDAAHYWDRRGGRRLVGRTKRSIAAVAAVVCSAAAARHWVSPSRGTASPHRSRRRQTEAEVEVATNQEIVGARHRCRQRPLRGAPRRSRRLPGDRDDRHDNRAAHRARKRPWTRRRLRR
jgi:hypothetical protein